MITTNFADYGDLTITSQENLTKLLQDFVPGKPELISQMPKDLLEIIFSSLELPKGINIFRDRQWDIKINFFKNPLDYPGETLVPLDIQKIIFHLLDSKSIKSLSITSKELNKNIYDPERFARSIKFSTQFIKTTTIGFLLLNSVITLAGIAKLKNL